MLLVCIFIFGGFFRFQNWSYMISLSIFLCLKLCELFERWCCSRQRSQWWQRLPWDEATGQSLSQRNTFLFPPAFERPCQHSQRAADHSQPSPSSLVRVPTHATALLSLTMKRLFKKKKKKGLEILECLLLTKLQRQFLFRFIFLYSTIFNVITVSNYKLHNRDIPSCHMPRNSF